MSRGGIFGSPKFQNYIFKSVGDKAILSFDHVTMTSYGRSPNFPPCLYNNLIDYLSNVWSGKAVSFILLEIKAL